ncbi:PREDICTED: cinnamoyl-CoA reductase 1 [Camelina sativa]|uniref:Cinnamoyl-CoA reductase 1 n=1 Tax=Camelina sativa TaxID=90675 RepID=A0ABM0Z7P7_CAMSA|nr:PREDICTED: cinnamoyl-CoA reductase 1 [Camelina sativa]
MNGEGKVVCVTGAAGYIASWIVKLLLLRRYTVRATVRNPLDTKKTKHLLQLDGASERLKLFKADLMEEGSFDEAIEGCDGVFHTASPVLFNVTDPQTELIDPAVNGTLNVLKTCAKSSSVKRVILTSSTASTGSPDPNVLVDETVFNDASLCYQMKEWYAYSKILAEETGCRFAKENGIDLVVMNPGNVIGPVMQPTLNYSIKVIVDLMNGKIPVYSCYYRFVDVRDVSLAHIKAFEVPSASGRYIIVDPDVSMKDIHKLLHELFPELCRVDKDGENELSDFAYKVCVDKLKSLGIEFTPIKESLQDTIVSLKEMSLLI